MRLWALPIGVILFAGVSAGCESSRANRVQMDSQLPALVAHGEWMAEAADAEIEQFAWEFGRNNDRLGSPLGSRVNSVEYVEVRQRDYQRTINGRPREFSTTITSSLKRGVVR